MDGRGLEGMSCSACVCQGASHWIDCEAERDLLVQSFGNVKGGGNCLFHHDMVVAAAVVAAVVAAAAAAVVVDESSLAQGKGQESYHQYLPLPRQRLYQH